jgi:glycosyltransferase involved in cell wall biosynthesis
MHDLTTIRFRNPAKNWLVFTIKQQIYRWLNKRVAHKTRSIIVNSKYTKNDIVRFSRVDPSKVVVTYLAADQISDSPRPLKNLAGKDFILYVGRPLPHKNLKRLVDAYGQVKKSHPSLLLVLAGKLDKNYELLEGYADKRGVQGVVFTDFIEDASLRWLYENTRAYIFPSLSEGFGLPGLEAMVHGAPVVSTNATCLPEIYNEAAVYFDPTNADDMAAKINSVLDDEELAKELIEKGRRQAAKYSWRKMAEQTLEIYKEILD